MLRRIIAAVFLVGALCAPVSAGVLSFNGTSGTIKFSTLATALQNVGDGAWTMAIVFKRSGTGTFDALSYLLSGSAPGTTRAGLSIKDDNSLVVDVGTGSTDGTNFSSTANPYMFVISKGAGGSAQPRLGWKLGSGGAWTHVTFSQALADQVAVNALEIGTWQGSDFFAGWIGVVAWWEGAMSDANKEALDDNWRTSDLYNSAHGTPAFLAELNVAAASVVDLIGNASNISTTGTSLDSGETLNSWNFNGTGAATLNMARRRRNQ